MSVEPENKIKIQWDELNSRKVDQRLKEQEALARNRRQAEMQSVASDIEPAAGGSIWYNTIFAMAFFGLLGGLFAWGAGEILRFRPDPKAQAAGYMHDIGQITDAVTAGRLDNASADAAIEAINHQGQFNPYFAVYIDTTLSKEEKTARLAEVQKREGWKEFIANVLSFGLSGMMIAAFLSIAEPVVDRNRLGLLINGIAGASLGLIGGTVVSFFADKLFSALLNNSPLAMSGGIGEISYQQVLARSITWGVLGLFLMVGPGLVMRNAKKLFIGMAGGLVGGLVGGALFDPVAAAAGNNPHISRLVALVAIGVIAGIGTGLIENAAKSGWLKVTAGLIAGKQFILYRNPTFIGSGPECQIYLFKDAKVGKRHAAIHIVPGGFELENLPLGAITLVNAKPVERVRLRGGDVIQIGSSAFQFQEKKKEQ